LDNPTQRAFFPQQRSNEVAQPRRGMYRGIWF
jgi:hypothetical protein